MLSRSCTSKARCEGGGRHRTEHDSCGQVSDASLLGTINH